MPINETKRLNILIVDDNIIYRKLLIRMLTKHFSHRSNRICEAETGEEGLNLLSEVPFDLVFMDIDMPIMSGLHATRIIRGIDHQASFEILETNKNVPIIACTTNDSEEDILSYRKAGMDGFIAKPILLNSLKYMVDSTLKVLASDRNRWIAAP